MHQYKVLLVDDEPLVLAGIKIMVNWQALDCELIGNAKNGKQALDTIHNHHPDIVIADINMPIMNGIELLKQCQEAYHEIVFIMLTNLQDFEYAKDCLHYQAVEYLVKTQLNAMTLQEAIETAKKEARKRRKLCTTNVEEEYEHLNLSKMLNESISLLISTGFLAPGVSDILHRYGILNSYLFLSVQLLYPSDYYSPASTDIDHEKLYLWEREIVDELARNCFPNSLMIYPEAQNNSQSLLLLWGASSTEYAQLTEQFYHKLATASRNLTRITPCILTTKVCSDKEDLLQCREQLITVQNYFYLTGKQFINFDDVPKLQYQKLTVNGLVNTLKKEVNSKNVSGISSFFSSLIERLKKEDHEPADALWLCKEIYFSLCETIKETGNFSDGNGLFQNPSSGYTCLRYLSTRKEVIHFLTALSNELLNIVHPATSHYDLTVDKVKEYVMEHINQRITLMEVAKHVYLSPGYLSAMFKKHCNESLIDFINRKKMERACELIAENSYLISQISDMLSFENAYYFTRVFKRYIGMTPSEYQERERRKHVIQYTGTESL